MSSGSQRDVLGLTQQLALLTGRLKDNLPRSFDHGRRRSSHRIKVAEFQLCNSRAMDVCSGSEPDGSAPREIFELASYRIGRRTVFGQKRKFAQRGNARVFESGFSLSFRA